MAATVLRWRFVDPADENVATREYVFPNNPKAMTSPFPSRTINVQQTTAVDGQPILWEGNASPKDWTFSGTTLDKAHYEALRKWVLGRRGRIYVYDHFGRRLTVIFKAFDVTPPEKHKRQRYWYHSYQISALVLQVTTPTVGPNGPV